LVEGLEEEREWDLEGQEEEEEGFLCEEDFVGDFGD